MDANNIENMQIFYFFLYIVSKLELNTNIIKIKKFHEIKCDNKDHRRSQNYGFS